MHEYEDKNNSTPYSLLEETVAYAREILEDLGRTNLTRHKKFSHIHHLSVECCTSETPDYVRNMYEEKGAFLSERESYEASHPAIQRSFRSIIEKLMEESGFTRAKAGERTENHAENHFSTSEITGTTSSIMSFGIFCHTSPEKLRAALMPSKDQLQLACFEALRDVQKKMGIDQTSLDATATYAEDLAKLGPTAVKPARRPKHGLN